MGPTEPASIAEHNAQVDARRSPGLGVMPGSPLEQMLIRLPRSERRLLLATIQTGDGRRRTRRERQTRRRLAARGIA